MKLNIFYQNNFFYLTLALAASSLSFAVFVQHALGHYPCPMCIYQRWPYFFMLIFSLGALLTKNYKKLFLVLIMFAILSSVLLALFHTGIELNIWKGLDSCNNQIKLADGLSLDEMKTLLDAAPVANCAVSSFKIFGLSMAKINFIMNLILLIISLRFYKVRFNYDKV